MLSYTYEIEENLGGNLMGSYTGYSGKGSTSNHKSNYSGKNSTSYSGKSSTPSYSSSSPSWERKNTSSMVRMLELLNEVEACRAEVERCENNLDSAKRALTRAEKKVAAQVNKLDPETRARFRKMMNGMDALRDDDEFGR